MYKNKEYIQATKDLTAQKEAEAKEAEIFANSGNTSTKTTKEKSDKYGVNWQSDNEATNCNHCERAFSLVRRRHHCRKCGGIFCNHCCKTKIKVQGSKNKKRICDDCKKTLQVTNTKEELEEIKATNDGEAADTTNAPSTPTLQKTTNDTSIHQPQTKKELQQWLLDWMKNGDSFEHGHPNTWNTIKITDMSELFRESKFNEDINAWNTSNVTTMNGMFCFAEDFNHSIEAWDTKNVTDMGSMFVGCTSFNQNLSKWNVGACTNMVCMFEDCIAFNTCLNDWNTSACKFMSGMFCGATSFNQPLNKWNVELVSNISEMFKECTMFNQSLNQWNLKSCTNMRETFKHCAVFNQPLNNWNTTSCKSMSEMFSHAFTFNQTLDAWSTSSVTTMKEMFKNATNFNQNLKWDINSVTNNSDMFVGSGFVYKTEEEEEATEGGAVFVSSEKVVVNDDGVKATEAKVAEEEALVVAAAKEKAKVVAAAKVIEDARVAAEIIAKAEEEAKIAAAKVIEDARVAAETKAQEEAKVVAAAKVIEETRVAAETKEAEEVRIKNIAIANFVTLLQQGIPVIKHPRKGKPEARIFWYQEGEDLSNDDVKYFCVGAKKMKASNKTKGWTVGGAHVQVKVKGCFMNIVEGCESLNFQRTIQKYGAVNSDCCFSVHLQDDRTFDLQFQTKETRDMVCNQIKVACVKK